MTAAAPELAPWTSLLGVVLDVTLSASPEVAELEERHRAERVPELVADLLERMLPTSAMVVVEDAHLADPASEVVLTAVARRTERRPWLLLVTREDRPTGWVLTDTRRIELGPLDIGSSRELAEMATPERPLPPAIAEELAARAGGHPLLLRELARAVARGEDPDELPRLWRSSPRARSTGCRQRSVHCCGGPPCSAMSSTRTYCSIWSPMSRRNSRCPSCLPDSRA